MIAALPSIDDRAHLSFTRVIDSERIKFTTLRSNPVTLLIVFAAVAGLGLLTAVAAAGANDAAHRAGILPGDLLGNVSWIQIITAILGVLFIASEYTSGSARTTFLAVPTRVPVLLAKLLVLACAVFITGVAGAVAAVLGGTAILHQSSIELVLAPPITLQLIVGAGLYLATTAILSLALGAIIRNVVGGILAAIGLLLVAPLLLGIVPVDWIHRAASFLPAPAGQLILAPENVGAALTPWGGYLVLLAWTVCATILAAILLVGRDV
ncbi:hypothetical protein [Glaciihabitans sp. UYNi722]|uniref:hypothetical protein n=1 Tax=Glaciihabitans sp. UYNi722 TaxID=3156344 RepID=UPI0033942E1E